jgi:hypothetical protein
MQIQTILTKLKRYDRVFQRKAVQAAIANQEQITPDLLTILDFTARNAEALLDRPNYMGHIYAMYLLAQFREERAYPLLVNLFSIPGDITTNLTGDVVTEDLGRILASVSGGDTGLMMSLVENANANEWVRGAALRGLLVLVAQGEKSRDDILTYFQSLFRGKLAREEPIVWTLLADSSIDLYPDMVYEDIKQAYEDDLIDPMFFGLDDVDGVLARGKEAVLEELRTNPHYTLIEDAIKELEGWACFDPAQPRQAARAGGRKKKVGRNDPCPCGSGRKYKHCCGKKH